MDTRNVISVVLNAHAPFVRHQELPQINEENWFFESLSETYLPLIEVFDRLDADRIPFRLGISLSPTLCHLLRDESLIERYLEYTDKQLEFGLQELQSMNEDDPVYHLTKLFYDKMLDRRFSFTERYEKNILKAFDYYLRKGKIELLTTAATHAFLPFYAGNSEAVQTQLEVALASYRSNFGKYPQGFWLPELAWSPDLGRYLRAYNFGYTIVNTHGLIFGDPPAIKGSFYPVKTPQGVFIFARDHYASRDIDESHKNSAYLDNNTDAGYELPPERVKYFIGADGSRSRTGYKYYSLGEKGREKELYEPKKASCAIKEQITHLLNGCATRLESANEYIEETPVSLFTYNLNPFGHFWYECPEFIETLFREGAKRENVQFMTPAEYLYKQDISKIQTMTPEFSSAGENGYAEVRLGSGNDWIYRHIARALERMTELAERFPQETGIKERALNQAAREILLAQSSDWAKLLHKSEVPEYARTQIEGSLRNFTTIYEALGSNYISTEWLTKLERRHNIFPNINYRVFRRKH